jgi:antitoxin component YwqK of YwqJK toxin-antitoxin module
VNRYLILFVFFFLSIGSWSQVDQSANSNQETGVQDTIRLYLIPPPQIDTRVFIQPIPDPPIIYPPIIYPPIGYPPYEWQFPIIPTTGFYIIRPTCGETRHRNGKLSSRIACKNGIQHGKSEYFNEQGIKTQEYYYLQGKTISNKSYNSKGKLLSWVNYDGKGELHGINWSFDEQEEKKIITHYLHGIEHGTRQEFLNGKLNLQEEYDHGTVTDRKYYFENNRLYEHIVYYNGSILEHTTFYEQGGINTYALSDSSGNRIIDYTKNERGIINSERHYKNNSPVGTTLESYDDLTGYKLTADYQNGLIQASYEYNKSILVRKKHFTNGQFDSLISFYSNGDTSELLLTGSKYHQLKWNLERQKTDDYWYYHEIFFGKGHFTKQDTTYLFEASNDPNSYNQDPIKLWVIYKNDTLRLDYIHNNRNIPNQSGPFVLHRNHFAYDSLSNSFVRNGQWSNFEGNVITEVITYKNGIVDGGYILYNESNPPTPIITGHYSNGQKDGLWIYKTGQTELINYSNGVLNGLYRLTDSQNIVLENGNYQNGQLIGEYTWYHSNSNRKSVVTFAQGQEIGHEKVYDSNGRLYREGAIKRNLNSNTPKQFQAIGKWYYYTYKPNGKAKRKTVKMN